MWYVECYCDVELGIFSTEEKARAALVAYHGNEADANQFGRLREYTVDIFENSDGQQLDYRDTAPTSPVQPLPGQLPPSVALLPPSTSYTPAQALQASMHHAEHLEQLLVIGQYHPEPGTDKQLFFCIGSRLDLGKALWLHRRLGLYIDENA